MFFRQSKKPLYFLICQKRAIVLLLVALLQQFDGLAHQDDIMAQHDDSLVMFLTDQAIILLIQGKAIILNIVDGVALLTILIG